jgi:hypothetical protein
MAPVLPSLAVDFLAFPTLFLPGVADFKSFETVFPIPEAFGFFEETLPFLAPPTALTLPWELGLLATWEVPFSCLKMAAISTTAVFPSLNPH